LTDATDLTRRWDQFKPEETRQLVETITDKIIIGKEEVAVDLLYLPGAVGKQRGHADAAKQQFAFDFFLETAITASYRWRWRWRQASC
jgi:hypothetical protein